MENAGNRKAFKPYVISVSVKPFRLIGDTTTLEARREPDYYNRPFFHEYVPYDFWTSVPKGGMVYASYSWDALHSWLARHNLGENLRFSTRVVKSKADGENSFIQVLLCMTDDEADDLRKYFNDSRVNGCIETLRENWEASEYEKQI